MVPHTLSVICVRLDYRIDEGDWPLDLMKRQKLAYVSRYALGRDYHKVVRARLQKLSNQITAEVGEFGAFGG